MLDQPKLSLSMKLGFYGGLVALFLCLIGMVESFGERGIISDVLSLGHGILLIVGLVTGYLTARFVRRAFEHPAKADEPVSKVQLVISGLVAGFITGLMLAIFVAIASRFNLRTVLVSVSPALLRQLTFDQGATVAALLQLVILGVILGGIGSASHVLPGRVSRPILWGFGMVLLGGLLSELLRITLDHPGWPKILSQFSIVILKGLTIRGTITIFVITAGIVLARPYFPALYRRIIETSLSFLPTWFRWIFAVLFSLWLLLRLVWFIGIDTEDLSLLPGCGEDKLMACLNDFDQIFQVPAPVGATGLATLIPTILGAVTLIEMLLLMGVVVAIVLLVVGGVRWAQLAPPEREGRTPVSGVLEKSQRYLKIYFSCVLLLFIPVLLGSFPSEVMTNIGLYVVMGFGINIVVGFAGLLDLGYVAFFAVGAYTAAVLTSPESALAAWLQSVFGTQPSFWVALPFVFLMTAVAGILVGAPVLRMRGDYLAIVTLGLGEIARFLALSDWLRPYLGGSQGILKIPKPAIAGVEFSDSQRLYYLLLAGALVALFISSRIKGSRVGRAWVAMREDEDVADAMGINTIQYKLLAFAMGALIASFSGAVFAAKLGSVFPHSFNVLVSITALSLLIIGGIGSLPGVVIGAIALVGIPELLREFAEYRLFFYGAVLVIMMIVRPEGLMPDVRRTRELHEEELSQDAWLKTPEVEPAGSGSAD